MRLAFRMFLRDFRAGELTVLALSLFIAVSVVSTVGFFSDRVRHAMNIQANKFLGADLAIHSDHPLDEKLGIEAKKTGLDSSSVVKFPSMVAFKDRSLLCEIKAVDKAYPLRGKIKVSPDAPLHPGSVWIDSKLMSRLSITLGDFVEVGETKLKVAGVIEEADESLGLMVIGPRLMMNSADLQRTALIRPGSRIQYSLLLSGEEKNLGQFKSWADKRLALGEKMETVKEARPEVKSVLDKSEVFLNAAALLSLVLAAVAVALSSRRFTERHLDGCALMRVLGARQRKIFLLYFYHFLLLGFLFSALGSLAGFLAQNILSNYLAGMVDIPLPEAGFFPALEAILIGMLLLFGFALPPIFSLSGAPPIRVFRREESRFPFFSSSGLISIAAIFFLKAGDATTGFYFFAGFLAAFLISGFLSFVFLKTLNGGKGKWRLGISNLKRRGFSSIVQIVSIGLGLMAILCLTLVRSDLMEYWQKSLPKDAPNRFLVNIQPEQQPFLSDYFSKEKIPEPKFFPMVKGRLVEINHKGVSSENYEELRAKRLIDREFNLSWAKKMQEDNAIVAGHWFDAEKEGFSIEEGLAKTLSIHLGDLLTFDVAGKKISARVKSLRKVSWDSFRVNFFVLSPPGFLDDFPRTLITSFYLPEEKSGVLNQVVRLFPNFLVIDVAALLDHVRKIADQAARAVEFVFVFSLFSGFMVLFAAFSSTMDERTREAAILRVLGARRKQIFHAHMAEFMVMGSLSGLFAATGATGLSYLISTKLMELSYSFDPWIFVTGILSGAAGLCLFGFFGTRRVLNTPPSFTLRSLEG